MSDPLLGRIRMMVARAVIALVDDGRAAQSLQLELLDEEAQDGVERFGEYGLASRPHPGAEAVAVAVGGLRSHLIVVAVEDRRYRLRALRTGEVALYDDLGQVVHLTRDGIVLSSNQAVTIEAPAVAIEADDISLGGAGGAAVARVGDSVADGVITSGSARVTAA